MITELKSIVDFNTATQEHTPLGKVCVYLFEEGSNAHSALKATFERVSRFVVLLSTHTMLITQRN